MTAKCKTCKKHWNISVFQQVPPGGYECPKCEHKRKMLEWYGRNGKRA